MSTLRSFLKKDYVKTVFVIAAIVGVVFGFIFGLELALGTSVPLRVVESGSMCVPYDGGCDGWTHPFAQTLHVGDIIVIQKVNPNDLNANYPNGDIIVYENPNEAGNPGATPIVHRIVAKTEINGTWYFQTKGDGNGQKWPKVPPESMYDSSTIYSGYPNGVPQNLVEGRVVLRIPWFGNITLFMRNNQWSLPVVIAIILLLVVVELVLPVIRGRKGKPQEAANPPAQPA